MRRVILSTWCHLLHETGRYLIRQARRAKRVMARAGKAVRRRRAIVELTP
jgi:hypothetical protein